MINFSRNLNHHWKRREQKKIFRCNHNVNVKQVSLVKSSKFNGFLLAVLCILGLVQILTLENFQLYLLAVFCEN